MSKLITFIGKKITSIELAEDGFVHVIFDDGTEFQFASDRIYDMKGNGLALTDLPEYSRNI